MGVRSFPVKNGLSLADVNVSIQAGSFCGKVRLPTLGDDVLAYHTHGVDNERSEPYACRHAEAGRWQDLDRDCPATPDTPWADCLKCWRK